MIAIEKVSSLGRLAGCLLLVCLTATACNKEAPEIAEARANPETVTPGEVVPNPDATPAAPEVIIPDASTGWETLATLPNYQASCGDDIIDLGEPIVQIAESIQAKKIPYDSEPLSDCSGMFHRVLIALKNKCDNHDFPDPEEIRSTRNLAEWYHNRGELILVRDPLNKADLIKPGAVLFYGKPGVKPPAQFTAEDLYREVAGKPRGLINHMGVVARIDTNADGSVKEYFLFHGRSGSKPAAITQFHKRNGKPPFGNGREHIVAFARILNPDTEKVSS